MSKRARRPSPATDDLRPRKESRVGHLVLPLALPTDLLDHVLATLWPDNLGALTRAMATCKQLQRLDSVSCVVLEQLGMVGPEWPGLRAGAPMRELAANTVRAREAMDSLIEARVSEAPSNQAIGAALSTLKQCDPMCIASYSPLLLSMLQDANASVRTNVIHTLRPLGGKWNGTHAIGALVLRLNDDNHWARFAALRTIEGFEPQAVAPHYGALCAQLSASDFDSFADRMVRQTALTGLSRLCYGQWEVVVRAAIVELLPQLLEDEDPEVVRFANRDVARFLTSPRDYDYLQRHQRLDVLLQQRLGAPGGNGGV